MNPDHLREMLKRHEGWKMKPYRCSRGFWTIGCGWKIAAHKMPDDIASYLNTHGEITDAMADRLLEISQDTATRQALDIFPRFEDFTDNRQMALVDMIFNMGAGAVMGFTKTRRAIDNGDWIEAARQVNDSAYWRQLGGDPAGTDDGKFERPEEIAQMLREG